MWPWITAYVNQQFNLWDEQRITYPGFYFGIRDGGFMLLYAAELGAVHPDSKIRADFKTRSLKVAKDYYARLQQPDGSYRWDDQDFPFVGVEQPFQVGILNEGMVAVHRLTRDETIKNAIIKSAEHEYQSSYSKNGWRATYYFVHGSMGKNPVVNCERGCGNAANAFPPADPGQIAEARQLNATGIHVFGYAYLLSGNSKFRTWGDEIFDSTYSGKDGYRGLAAARGKEYDESYRTGGRYLAWRLTHGGDVAVSEAAPEVTNSTVASAPGTPTVETTGSPRELIATALDDALRLSAANSITGAELQTLLDEIRSAYSAVASGNGHVSNADEVLKELKAAEDHAVSVVLIIKSQNGLSENSRLRLGWTAARLKRAANGLNP
jgi:hypothetical protein